MPTVLTSLKEIWLFQ